METLGEFHIFSTMIIVLYLLSYVIFLVLYL